MRHIFILPLFLTFLPCPAPAKTWVIEADGSGTAPTIQEAIDRATPGDSLALGPGTYYESPIINLPLVVYGREGAEATILSGDQNRRIMIVNSGQPTVFRSLSFVDGNAGLTGSGGAAEVISTAVSFTDCIFTNNSANHGGAVHISTAFQPKPSRTTTASAVFQSCSFNENVATGLGGAVYIEGSEALLDDCLFEGNHSKHGGAVYIKDTDLAVQSCRFTANAASGSGGAGCSQNLETAGIRNSEFIDNLANGDGGAWCTQDVHSLLIDQTVFRNNGALMNGGAVRALGSLQATQSLWNNNRASTRGGGLLVGAQGSLTLNHCTFVNNTAAIGSSLSTEASSNHITFSVFADPSGTAITCSETESITGSCNLRSTAGIGGCLDFAQTALLSMCPADATQFCNQPEIPGCGPVGHLPPPCAAPGCGNTPIKTTTWGDLKRQYGDP